LGAGGHGGLPVQPAHNRPTTVERQPGEGPAGEDHSTFEETVSMLDDHVTDATWDAEVLAHRGVVIVDVGARWCTPCQGFSPLVQQFGREHPRVRVRQLDVDDNPVTARRYAVTTLPTLLVVRDGALVQRLVGTRQTEQLKRELTAHLRWD
jgi:thioredoxin 1